MVCSKHMCFCSCAAYLRALSSPVHVHVQCCTTRDQSNLVNGTNLLSAGPTHHQFRYRHRSSPIATEERGRDEHVESLGCPYWIPPPTVLFALRRLLESDSSSITCIFCYRCMVYADLNSPPRSSHCLNALTWYFSSLQIDCNTVMGTFDMAEDDGFDLHLQVCIYLNSQACMHRIKPCLTCGVLEGLLLVITTSLHEKSGIGHNHSHVRNWVEAASSTSAVEVHAAFISFIRGGQNLSNTEDILPLIMPFRARK